MVDHRREAAFLARAGAAAFLAAAFCAVFPWALRFAAAAPAPKEGAAREAGSGEDEGSARARRALGSLKAGERLEAAEDIRRGKARLSRRDMEDAARKEANPQVRYTLLQALAEREGSAAEDALLFALQNDPAMIVRAAAAQQLRRIAGGTKTVQALSQALSQDKEAEVRRACAFTLGFYPSEQGIAALERAAESPDTELRRQTAKALRMRPGASADRILKKLEKDKDPAVAGAAKRPEKR